MYFCMASILVADIALRQWTRRILDYVKQYYEILYASVDTNLVMIDLDNIIFN